jgi:hypothetical protein
MLYDIQDNQLPYKKRSSRSPYIICASDIEYKKTSEWRMLNALREANQKRIMNAPQIKQIKKRHEVIVDGLKMWNCPRCCKTVKRLTAAHVGPRVISIIHRVMQQYSAQFDDFLLLDNAVMHEHRNVRLAVCCDKCNKEVDDTCQ